MDLESYSGLYMYLGFDSVHPGIFTIIRLSAAVGLVLASVLASAQVNVPGARVADGGSDLERRVQAEEESCISNLRTINVAQGTYWGGDAKKGFARGLKQLGPKGAGLIEPVLASGKKNDYRFRLMPEPADSSRPVTHYVVVARPVKRLAKGQRSFYTDESGVIRFTSENRAAKVDDPPIK